MKERVVYADLLKIIACIAVITIHVTATIIYRENIKIDGWMTAHFYNSLCRWAVPIFVMVSGLFIVNFDFKKGLKMSLKTFKILFVWSFLYFLGNATIKNKFYILNFNFKEMKLFLKNFLNGNISPHLWYLYMLVGLYISVIFLKKVIKNSSKKELQIFILIGFIYSILIPTMANFPAFAIYKVFSSKMYLNIFSCYFMYLVLGYYIHTYNVEKKYRFVIYALAIVSLILTYTVTKTLSLSDGKINETLYRNSSINVFFVSLGLFLFFKNAGFEKMKDKYKDYASKLVSKTFGIYLVHQIVINVLNKIGFNLKMFNVFGSTLVVVFVCFVISLVFVMVVDKIKILKRILF